ncbi:hypothetical protein [Streptomyces sp. bgisy034]|uniref:hypothetical protein n=1 Tax=Streptomyces sp. bgisy034 TaxID=3413774 RepID=UPI003EB78A9C
MFHKLRARIRPLIPIAVIAAVATAVAPAQAASAAAPEGVKAAAVASETIQQPLTPHPTPGSDKPAEKPDGSTLRLSDSPTCTDPTPQGRSMCVQQTPAPDMSRLRKSPSLAQDGVAPPQWCEQSNNTVIGTRTQVCRVSGLTYWTRWTQNGQTTLTGEAYMILINYSYGDTGLGTIAHQIETSVYDGWGDALNAKVDGQATMSGACTRESSSFPARPLLPLNSWTLGESFFDTTATAPGAKGNCQTFWYLTFTNNDTAKYPNPAFDEESFNEFRCDNATAGRATVGCVVPWYASNLVYSKTSYPSLASHVERAQASGLPGATFAQPLHRTEDETVAGTNRELACGDAPSISGLSCDEYPIARSKEGLSAGGTRRTFDGCQMPNVSSGTGPTGVSVCMITATENNAQGGLNTQFFRAERVLQDDPFRVTVS